VAACGGYSSQRSVFVAKRIFLFVATNIAILVMVSLVLAVLGQLGVFDMAGGQGGLLILCAVWGFGAAIVSLLLSRKMAKWTMGVRLVDGRTGNPDLDWLYNKVGQLAQQANLPMPEVGFYESPEVNAFATGPSKKRSLVAVSTGLLRGMSREEVEGVLAHEISHVANGDMVTMTLIQGVVNAFVLYLSHIVAAVVRGALSRDDDRGPSFVGIMAGQLVFIAAQIVFGLLGSMITAWFSRQLEFRADAGGAGLSGRGAMIGALRRLQAFQGRVDNSRGPELATLKINGGGRFMQLLSTHPPLELRIAALESRA
jgi:heat shock protein HtpX